MLDFIYICASEKHTRDKDFVIIHPKFIIKKSEDMMIRGGDFYAIWVEDKGRWSEEEQEALRLIDTELDEYAEAHKADFAGKNVKVLHMWDAESGMIDVFHKYCQRQLRDNFVMLDEKIIFSNTAVKKRDYASKRLNYPLEKGDISAYDRLMSVLYSAEERMKIEWAIGAVVSGDSKKIQKFLVLYGSAGTGKSTVLNIIQQLFDGYYSVFDAKALGSSNNSFALEAFKSNPLVAIQHDGDLSRIEDNTRLNSLVSHEMMIVNEKFKSAYSSQFKSFLFMGSNKPVKITDAKSGLIRRLIDVTPSGNKLNVNEYNDIVNKIQFELGAIAFHCLEVYENNKHLYDNYIPTAMLGATNDFYNFIMENYYIFEKEDCTSLKSAWEMYKSYCEEARVLYPYSQKLFKEELKNYFSEYSERYTLSDGTRVRSYYSGFKTDKFEVVSDTSENDIYKIDFKGNVSAFDEMCKDCPAQYANDDGLPSQKWDNVNTKLADIKTSEVHYVRVPENHIVIDFDIPDENGNKSFAKNLEYASRFPKTYAELSKSGAGIHLHYIYNGDVNKLSRIYDDHVEIKVFTGKSSLRRKLTKCNNLPIAMINSGLPLRSEEKMINFDGIKSEKAIRTIIKRNLCKEYHASTKPSIDFIHKTLEDAYNRGVHYDVSDMRNAVVAFGANSTNQSDYCLKLISKMHFKSDDISENTESNEKMIFFDTEVFPNLFVVCYKIEGDNKPVVRMINPSRLDIENLLKFRLVGFNCRRYDNHLLYACLMGYNNEQLYKLSQKIVSGEKNCFFGEAYNASYTDVYDFSSKKQSLKKFEIELGIHHQELGLAWDKPVAENLWNKVAEYCENDVRATEAVFNARKADFTARQILADVAGMTVNDTTNSLTTRIIFGSDKHPQSKFQYRNMSGAFTGDYTVFDEKNRPIFPEYKFENGKSTYRGEEVGEGGYVYAEPGIYGNVALLDIASMHPSSIVAENLFGDEYTQRFKDILDARIAIKHKDFKRAKTMLNGALSKYLTDEESASDLAQALKIAINSVYGLTSANFDNPFRDKRNIDNIVAKRGALFMINLKHEVQNLGYSVAHIKTDSIKIPDADEKIINFVMDYGKKYGYNFEHEATYDRMCLVNDTVYIARYKDGKKTGQWTATGTQFQVPYIFKSLFSKEKINFEDMCETKSVSTALYLDLNENLDENEHNYHFIGKVGSFCPIKSGCGGGLLCREKDGKYYSATGAKGYRWLEAEMVKVLEKEDCIDKTYYQTLCDKAVKSIEQYGDFEWFVSDTPYDKNNNGILPF